MKPIKAVMAIMLSVTMITMVVSSNVPVFAEEPNTNRSGATVDKPVATSSSPVDIPVETVKKRTWVWWVIGAVLVAGGVAAAATGGGDDGGGSNEGGIKLDW